MSDEDIIGAHHFEAAGIPVEDKKPEDQEQDQGNNAGTQEQKDETDPKGSEQEKKPETEADKKPDASTKDSSGDGKDPADKSGKEKEQPKPNRSEAELDAEGAQMAQEGETVRSGIALRWMHQRNTARQERDVVNQKYQEAERRAKELETQVETFKQATQAFGQLPPAEASHAVRLYTTLKQNPVATLKQLLVEAKANGHNIDGIGSGVDTAAIQNMLDQRLRQMQPTEQNRGSQHQQQGSEPKTVDNDDDLFLAAYPDAANHVDILVDMLNKNIADYKAGRATKVLGNTELYFTLKNAAEAQGFDFSKPLAPQIEARKNPPKQEEKKPQQQEAPRIAGRGGMDQVSEPLINTGGKEESFSDIVRRALAENPIDN
jgi:hypothetical protein